MNLSKQIKKYRTREQLSQEELAEKLYVSRQTISNWENEKSYPDIHNLLLMSAIFNASLDELVKGDVAMMKNEIENAQLNKWTLAMIVSMLIGIISIGPMMSWLGNGGAVLSFALIAFSIFAAFKIEKIKKKHNLKTYKQILAFQEGRLLSDEDAAYNRKKDILTKVATAIVFAIISGIITYASLAFFGA